MYIHRKTLLVSFLALLMMSAYVDVHFAAAQTNTGQSSLEAASDVIYQAFNRMLAAERAGANVAKLLDRLNGAVNLLAEAENEYKSGNFAAVEEKTDGAVFIARQVTSESQFALEEAQNSASTRSWLTLALTVVTIIMLVLVLLIVWVFIKRRYIKDLIKSKSKVITDET